MNHTIMKRYRKEIICCFILIFTLCLTGCSGGTKVVERKVPERLHVQFTSTPQVPQVNEETIFSVVVTQNGESVNDADEVKFEIWQKGQKGQKETHIMLPAKKTGDGSYAAKQRFAKPGEYYVMYHIDARGLHSMTNHKIEVKKG
jgi:hypothetical protein